MASFAATGEYAFAALVVGVCGWGRGDPGSTNPGEPLCSPTSLPALRVSSGTSDPVHRIVSDFSFPVLLPAVHPMPSTPSAFPSFLFLSCCTLSAAFLLSHPWFCQVHHLQPHFSLLFTSAGHPLLHFCPTKHVTMSPEKQKRTKKRYM